MHLLLGAINCLSFCRLLKWHSLACTSVVLASSFSLYLSSCISHMVAHYKVGNSINSGASMKKEKKRILSHFTQVVTFTKITLTRAQWYSRCREYRNWIAQNFYVPTITHWCAHYSRTERERELYDYRNSECDFDFELNEILHLMN